MLQKTPCSFDVSVWEFFWPLMVGARLVMAPPEAHRDPQQLQQLIAQHRITTLHFVPSMLAAFVAAPTTTRRWRAAPRCASVLQRRSAAGGAVPPVAKPHGGAVAQPLRPDRSGGGRDWHPAYGEALAKVTGANVPIGLPVWNTGLRILMRACGRYRRAWRAICI